jgi:putative ABC transport system substrate-binding protein
MVVVALCLLLAAPLAAEAQQIKKTPRIAFIFLNIPETELARPNPTSRYAQAFLEGMRQLGWIDGQNITIEWRTAAGHPERYPAVAQELVKLPVDVVVTSSTSTAIATRQATSRIPIVVAGGDLFAAGALSFAHPGGTVTGLMGVAGPEINGKRLQFLKEACPQVSRVAVLFSNLPGYMEEAERMEWKEDARTLGLTLAPVEVTAPDGFETAFASIQRARVRAMVLGGSPFFLAHRQKIIEFAAKESLPAMYWERIFAESGGLMSYGPDLADVVRRAAIYVDKILKGANPGTLPIERPTKFELVINLKTAKALGLTIPPSVLARADQVIE